ncbi:MAG: hypothetical protein K2H29_02895 [Oscillospiraceae bacterium]|nr:hypothetical protein [Oscillospiraceae bacterium]
MPEIISKLYAAVKEVKETTDVQEVAQLVNSKEWVVLAMAVKEEIILFSIGRID